MLTDPEKTFFGSVSPTMMHLNFDPEYNGPAGKNPEVNGRGTLKDESCMNNSVRDYL